MFRNRALRLELSHVSRLYDVRAAVACSPTSGPNRHIGNALRTGATRDEVAETIELTTVMGTHACDLAIPIR